MTGVGFAYFLCVLTASEQAVIFTIGLLLSNVFLVVALHMLLAFPTGRLATRGLRRLVAAAYVSSRPAAARMDAVHAGALLRVHRPAARERRRDLGLLDRIRHRARHRLRDRDRPARRERDRPRPPLAGGDAARAPRARAGPLHRPRPRHGPHRALRGPGDRQHRHRRRDRLHPGPARVRRAALRVPRRPHAQPLVARRRGVRARRAPRGGARVAHARRSRRRWGIPTLRLAYWLPQAERLRRRERPRDASCPGDDDPYRAATLVEREGERDRRARPRPVALRGARARERGRRGRGARDGQRAPRGRAARPAGGAQRVPRAAAWRSGIAERQRLERDLHDGAQQRLIALSLQVARRPREAHVRPGGGGRDPRPRPRRAARSRSRSCASSRAASIPAVLTDRGLGAAHHRPRRALPDAGAGAHDAARAPAHRRRGRRLLRRLRVARQHGQARGRVARDGARRPGRTATRSWRSTTTAAAARAWRREAV